MVVDITSPAGSDGLPILNGQVVTVFNSSDSSKDGNYVYTVVDDSKSWKYIGGQATAGEIASARFRLLNVSQFRNIYDFANRRIVREGITYTDRGLGQILIYKLESGSWIKEL